MRRQVGRCVVDLATRRSPWRRQSKQSRKNGYIYLAETRIFIFHALFYDYYFFFPISVRHVTLRCRPFCTKGKIPVFQGERRPLEEFRAPQFIHQPPFSEEC